MKYAIDLLEVGIWETVDVAETFEDALSIASMYANEFGENNVQITGGTAINEL